MKLVHLGDINNSDLIKNDAMFPLISDLWPLSAARCFKVIAEKEDPIKSALYKFWHASTRATQNLWGFYGF